MQNRNVELLAPAGNVEAFYGAIHAGADAVYLGGSRFGARAYADNFTEEQLIDCIRYAHMFHRKVYLTVNTLVKESEMGDLYGYLKPFYEAGLDGVIVQDTGVFSFIKKHFPGIDIHVSTQMTITGSHGAAMLKKMGACRIVPARELSLAEIWKMKEDTGLEIETFIHGAMCYCYSGQCLFSSILGGRSGNRGRCAQPCRLPYSVNGTDKFNGKNMSAGKRGGAEEREIYPLSLKDMCTIEMLPELIEAGIDSFKIEGRMKKPEYAAGVTAIYRKYIDKYYRKQDGKASFKVSREDLDKLSKLYIRSERQNGYYHKHNGKDMITLESPAYSGSDDNLLNEIRETYLNKTLKHPVSVYGVFQIGEAASVTFFTEEVSVTVTGEVVQEASKQPISSENIEKQLGKLGDSVFVPENISVQLDEGAFYSLKAINELRREAVARLEDLLIEAHSYPVKRTDAVEPVVKSVEQSVKSNNDGLHISVHTLEQLKAVQCWDKEGQIARLYIHGDLLVSKEKETNAANGKIEPEKLQSFRNKNAEIVISLPGIIRAKDEQYLEKIYELAQENKDIISGFSVGSPEAMGYLLEKEYCGKIYADPGFYLWNQEALAYWSSYLQGFCMPYELNGVEQKALLKSGLPCEKIFYGRIPMMVTANCVLKTTGQCKKVSGNQAEEPVKLTDRYRKQFPVEANCQHCYNIIYNTVPLSLHADWKKWKGQASMRLAFTMESRRETEEVLAFFGKVYEGSNLAKEDRLPFGEYTTGHEKRGVE